MGFEFDIKKKIEICGKLYECDASNNNLILGVMLEYPNVVASARAVLALKGKQCTADEVAAANEALLTACVAFIEGTLGVDEYKQIFAGRHPSSADHLQLCAYIYAFLQSGRGKVVEAYLDEPV
ncbi:MAG: hypothetical protein GXZ14_00830 [Ruminococcaceae bacterium]|nr:hypothetical protein [Oscillospiraceae bacterium]